MLSQGSKQSQKRQVLLLGNSCHIGAPLHRIAVSRNDKQTTSEQNPKGIIFIHFEAKLRGNKRKEIKLILRSLIFQQCNVTCKRMPVAFSVFEPKQIIVRTFI